jgi:membrane protease YdiL (CAAX protease family)
MAEQTASALDLGAGAERRYARLSMRPLHILLFLVPFIAAYEVGSLLYLTGEGGTAETIRAHRILSEVFAWFGAGGLHLPAALTVVVLLVWQFLSGDKWAVSWRVLPLMLAECIAWTLPLLVLGLLLVSVLGINTQAAAAVTEDVARGLGADLTIAIGAGVYEELLFRMVGLGLVHMIAVDLLRLRDAPGQVVSVIVTSLAFALYHDVAGAAGGGSIDWLHLSYYFLAGVAFGVIYLLRGFGIAVGVHALYDVVVLVRPFN